ncbi:MAG: class I SAM-dependent methyltransferase [Thermodesulfovibrio sp.]|uniref:class I SAM-dependent methyltransferase n=1 Tax=unclassified Thermodesulfovibrio TaxID=2645936 RepID=UPI00083AF0BC|nr:MULTISPECIES: class I SAM-dependent methyltransferase [unclassified Thermodesulfovibrio]MDI1471065.1 class I SAM-dependent methyltransferase [Thermodesulfovibrio sp. 1176]MDI6713915.1 class I SAM-dependent methyltransferase [Thermodesulfovibrio sp.]ODA43694.1 hypothetical protein THER_1575 [Thermodesulfovibrio sp. N1]
MDELEKEFVIDFFTKRLIHFKDSPEAVGWTKTGQLLRYEAVYKLINPDGKKLLDFGCGKGDFYRFLKEKGVNLTYTGIDINPSLIKLAQKNYPATNFYVKDIESEQLDEVFDYTVVIGVFNLALSNIKNLMQRCLEILFENTKERLILTCLNNKTKFRDIGVAYFSVEELQRLAQSLTKDFEVLDNLIEGDLFLILDRK